MIWYKEDLYMDEITAKTIKLLEDSIGENLYDLGLGKNFLDKHQ